jgi:hypothetical protein
MSLIEHWTITTCDGCGQQIVGVQGHAGRCDPAHESEIEVVRASDYQGAVDALREAWLGEKSGRRYALHGPTHNCTPDVCQIGQCPAIRALLGGGR